MALVFKKQSENLGRKEKLSPGGTIDILIPDFKPGKEKQTKNHQTIPNFYFNFVNSFDE